MTHPLIPSFDKNRANYKLRKIGVCVKEAWLTLEEERGMLAVVIGDTGVPIRYQVGRLARNLWYKVIHVSIAKICRIRLYSEELLSGFWCHTIDSKNKCHMYLEGIV